MSGETELAQNCSFQPLEFLPTPSQGGDHHYSRKKPSTLSAVTPAPWGPAPPLAKVTIIIALGLSLGLSGFPLQILGPWLCPQTV